VTIEENKGKKFAVDYYVFARRFNRWNEGSDLLILSSTGAGG
jgi:hypothetical protein